MSTQSFGTVLSNMARELDALASLAGNIDHALGFVPMGSDIDRQTREALQKVDLLRQSLECFSHYVGNLARQVHETALVDPALAAQDLPLRDLARNLVSGVQIAEQSEQNDDRDDCFF